MAGGEGHGQDGDVRIGVSRLHHPVLTLGPGRRIGIWVQGCSIRCAGCMSRDTWEPAVGGERMPVAAIVDWAGAVPPDQVDGITISGGEPFDQAPALHALVRRLRTLFDPDRVDVLVYSGYGFPALLARHRDMVASVDAVVAGPYREQPGPQLRWRGSPNQQLIPTSDLGRRRYAEHLDAPADSGLQVYVHDGRIDVIGVPRPGALQRVEEEMSARGISLHDCSWR